MYNTKLKPLVFSKRGIVHPRAAPLYPNFNLNEEKLNFPVINELIHFVNYKK